MQFHLYDLCPTTAANAAAGGVAAQSHTSPCPSRLNPAQMGRRGLVPAPVHGRGTVSMPNSPLNRAVTSPWAEPNSAGVFLGATASDGLGVDNSLDIDLFTSPQLNQREPSQSAGFPSTTNTNLARPVSNQTDWTNTNHPDPFHIAPPNFSLNAVDKRQSGSTYLSPIELQPGYLPIDNPAAGGTSDNALGKIRQRNEYEDEADDAFYAFSDDYRSIIPADAYGGQGQRDSDQPSGNDTLGEPAKKKRQQVRVACTHCQKACKKCSNTRPCERCVRYGLSACVDSTRKPRKTGVKRGPYKRRPSSKANGSHEYVSRYDFDDTQFVGELLVESSPQNGPTMSLDVDPCSTPASDPRQKQTAHLGPQHPQHLVPPISYHYQAPPVKAQVQAQPNALPIRLDPFAGQTSSSTLPEPRLTGLESALTAAFATQGPRWVNGQRVIPAGFGAVGHAGVMMPHTPSVPFPMSLNAPGSQLSAQAAAVRSGLAAIGKGMDDPFSRAVSPIRGNIPRPSNDKRDQNAFGPEGHRGGNGDGAGVIYNSGMDADVDKDQPIAALSAAISPSRQPLNQAPIQNEILHMMGTPLNDLVGDTLGPQASSAAHPFSTATSGGLSIDPRLLSAPKTPRPAHNSQSESQQPTVHWATDPIRSHLGATNGATGATPYDKAWPAANWMALQAGNMPVPSQTDISSGASTPAIIALKRIKKPSLRTLMVPGISREGTPVDSPTGSIHSAASVFSIPNNLGVSAENGVQSGIGTNAGMTMEVTMGPSSRKEEGMRQLASPMLYDGEVMKMEEDDTVGFASRSLWSQGAATSTELTSLI